MASVNVNIIGTVKFFDQAKGFGIIVTKLGDVFIHVSKASGKQAELVADAEVRVDFFTTYKDGQYKHAATALLSVKALPAPVEVLDVVKFYSSEKNFGFIHCGGAGFSKDEAILRGNVANRAGIVPGKGMPVRAIVVEEPKGPVVISFQWGPQVEADYAAANPEPTEVGVLKYFDPKGFGFLVREDGSQIGFHIMGAAEGLRDDFKKKYRKGSTFAFVVGDYRGKETALIRELLALAPERDAESGLVLLAE